MSASSMTRWRGGHTTDRMTSDALPPSCVVDAHVSHNRCHRHASGNSSPLVEGRASFSTRRVWAYISAALHRRGRQNAGGHAYATAEATACSGAAPETAAAERTRLPLHPGRPSPPCGRASRVGDRARGLRWRRDQRGGGGWSDGHAPGDEGPLGPVGSGGLGHLPPLAAAALAHLRNASNRHCLLYGLYNAGGSSARGATACGCTCSLRGVGYHRHGGPPGPGSAAERR